MAFTAGIDAGTQSLKVVVYDPATRDLVAMASAPLDLMSGDDGRREQHAADWVAAMQACFSRIDPAVRARNVAGGGCVPPQRFVPGRSPSFVVAPPEQLFGPHTPTPRPPTRRRPTM